MSLSEDAKITATRELFKKERPILFSTEMVRAIQEGRKTQTRRVLKLPLFPDPNPHPDEWLIKEGINIWVAKATKVNYQEYIKCPYGQIGDRLWVRETWAIDDYSGDGIYSGRGNVVFYRATDHESCGHPWRPSIFMPRFASRITLEITGIRVERLQEIKTADAKAEGIEEILEEPTEDLNKSLRRIGAEEIHHPYPIGFRNYLCKHDKRYKYCPPPNNNEFYTGENAAKDSYYSLWDSINRKQHPWESNPWVWVIEFKKL